MGETSGTWNIEPADAIGSRHTLNIWPTDYPTMRPYCCAMRAHYIIGIVGVRKLGPPPVEVGEFIEDYEAGQPRILTRFCPFCGTSIEGQSTATSWTPNPEVSE